MAAESLLLQDLGFIILAGTLVAFLFRKLNQPLIVAYIFAGLLVGPIGLGLIRDTANVGALAQLGVAFLLFALGMEIDFSKLWQFKKPVLLGGLGQIVLNTLVVAALVHWIGLGLMESIYAGFIVSFSSTVIVVKILSERKQLNSLEGRLIIGYALVQDLVAVLVLPLLANPSAISNAGLLVGILASLALLLLLGILLSKFVFPFLIRSSAKHPELFYLMVLSSFFFFTAVSLQLNFSLAAGAFIGGLALSRTTFSSEALSIIRNIRDLFATIFFVSLGMQLTLFPFQANFLVFLVMIGVIFILNPIIFTVVNLSEGFGLRVSLFIGLALAQASEFSFILASQGFALGQISESVYNIAIWTIIISMIATPYMINRADSLHNWIRRRLVPKPIPFFRRRLEQLERLPPSAEPLENHIVIAGAGVFGSTLATQLQSKGPVVIVEQDPELVYHFAQRGFFAVFGSRQNQDVWEKTRLEKARLLIVTIPDKNAAVQVVRNARKKNPGLFIFGRAHYYRDALELYKNGADFVVMPQIIGSNFSLQLIEEFLDTGKKPKAAPLEDEYFRLLEEKALKEENHSL